MIDIMNPKALRERFAALGEQRDAILKVSTPLREERDEITETYKATVDSLSVQVAEAEDGLFDIDQERALIARALGGRTSQE